LGCPLQLLFSYNWYFFLSLCILQLIISLFMIKAILNSIAILKELTLSKGL
jgi:hypothetical protein